jgi:hypothetical protein
MAERRKRDQAAADAETAREKKAASAIADVAARETADGMRITSILPSRVCDLFSLGLEIGTIFSVAEILKDVAECCREPLRLALASFKKDNEDFVALGRLSAQLASLKSDLAKLTISLTAMTERYEHELSTGGDVGKLERELDKMRADVGRLDGRATTLARVQQESQARASAGWERRHGEVLAEMKFTAKERLIRAKTAFVSQGGSGTLRELISAWHFSVEMEQAQFRFPLRLD